MKEIYTKCKEILNNHQISLEQRQDKIQTLSEQSLDHHEFKKYQAEQNEIVDIIQNVAQSIDVSFDKVIDVSNPRSFAAINAFKNNTINIPNFILKQPKPRFLKKGKGYKIRLKWNIDNNIIPNYENISFWYKKNDHLWQKCKNYKLLLKKKTVELDEKCSFDNTYSFRIKYLMKNPLNMNTFSNTQRCSLSKPEDVLSVLTSNRSRQSQQFDLNDIRNININKHRVSQKLKLIYHSHRGHSGHHHPKYLLSRKKGPESMYFSLNNSEFNDDNNECDWIIFKFNKKFIPSMFYIKNNSIKSDVETMKVCFGDIKKNKWEESQNINVECRKKKQTFDISGIAKKSKFHYLKILFVRNHGETNPDKPRFGVNRFGIYGIQKKYAVF